MRSKRASFTPRASSTVTWVVSLAATVLLLACSGPHRIDVPDAPTTGELAGTVTLLGDVIPTASSARVSMYASVSDFDTGRAARAGEATRRTATPPTFAFHLDGITPGAYYIRVCFTFGCGEYRDGSGNLSSVPIRAGTTAILSLTF